MLKCNTHLCRRGFANTRSLVGFLSRDRFTVASRTEEGVSAESEPCVAVRPNEPLPEGWKEKFNAVSGKVRVGIAYRFHPHACMCLHGPCSNNTVTRAKADGLSPRHTKPCTAAIPPNQTRFRCPICQSVYTNVKTGQTSLERPESDPYFVETDLFLKFTPEETEALCEVFCFYGGVIAPKPRDLYPCAPCGLFARVR